MVDTIHNDFNLLDNSNVSHYVIILFDGRDLKKLRLNLMPKSAKIIFEERKLN